MPWSERRRSMLERMGLRVWSRATAEPVVPDESAPAPAAVAVQRTPVAAPAPPPRPATAAPQQIRRPATPILPDSSLASLGRSDIATLDWPALRDAVAQCRACGLCESRTQTVFGVGHPRAHWLVVGEAPGAEEDRQGEPFVGAAGQLLDRMLAALQLTRRADDGHSGNSGNGGNGADDVPAERRVYIANTLKCRPPGNRNPSAEEMARCEPFLLRQIELLQPRIVLAMGRFAVQALLKTEEPIGRLRGRVHRYQGLPLVVTYHPAYLLRSPAEKAKAWDDLCLAAASAGSEVLPAGRAI